MADEGARATLALRPNPDPEAYSPVVTDRAGRILSIAGRPGPARGTVSMFASVHVMDPSLLDRLPEGVSDSVRDLYLPLLAEGGRLLGVRTRGVWFDLGRPSLYLAAQLRLLPGGRALVDRSARVASSARVRRSVLGAGVRIGGQARIESSVVWEGAAIAQGARVSGAIIVSGASVLEGERAEGVIVMPAAALGDAREAGGTVELRGDQAWIDVA